MNDFKKHTITPDEFRSMDTAGKIMEIARNFEPPQGKPADEVFNAILQRAEASEPVKKIRLPRYFQSAAAVVLLLIGFYTVKTVFSEEKVKTHLAEQRELLLPDQSKVVLNADSKLSWSGKNFNANRKLSLKGEAFFSVTKGKAFVISTPNGKVEVLGTELNVFSRNKEFWVSCLSGKVKVSSKGETQIIVPGEKVKLVGKQLVKASCKDITQTVSWKEGLFYFEDKPLVSIFDVLERQFNVSVKFNGNKDRLITVTFSNKNLEETLNIICVPMNLKYEIKNNKISISEIPGKS